MMTIFGKANSLIINCRVSKFTGFIVFCKLMVWYWYLFSILHFPFLIN